MGKSLTIIKQNQEHVTDMFKDGIKTDLVCREIQRDTIGRSGASPTWVYVYRNVNGKMKFRGIALHKEYDYDGKRSDLQVAQSYVTHMRRKYGVFNKEGKFLHMLGEDK